MYIMLVVMDVLVYLMQSTNDMRSCNVFCLQQKEANTDDCVEHRKNNSGFYIFRKYAS